MILLFLISAFSGGILISGVYFHYCQNLLDAGETDPQYKHTAGRNVCVERMCVRQEWVQLALSDASALHPVIGGKQETSAVISSPGCSLVNVDR